MAGYKKEIDGEYITNTLTFMGKDFEERWEDSGAFCPCSYDSQITSDFPDLPDDIVEIICEFETYDDDEKLEAIAKLDKHEEKARKAGEL